MYERCLRVQLTKNKTEFKNKKVVVVAVPGAFTPTCSEQHIPTFLEQKEAFKKAGVDNIIVIASNDAFVMSAWGKTNGVTDDYIVSCPPPPPLFHFPSPLRRPSHLYSRVFYSLEITTCYSYMGVCTGLI